jgi:putative phosphoribosyl transferase
MTDEYPSAEPVTEVGVELEDVRLAGNLCAPPGSRGLVVFAHGSGSGRHSPRNQYVAQRLNDAGLATLLFDLLTTDEELDRDNVFDIPMLGERLEAVSEWALAQPELRDHAVGYFGASTGAGAALWAAAAQPDIFAVVSRGGRPDLAASRLHQVSAPTLLIVGGRDPVVERLNREAQTRLRCQSRLVIIPGATHLFGEPGALDEVDRLASEWFLEHLRQTKAKEENDE